MSVSTGDRRAPDGIRRQPTLRPYPPDNIFKVRCTPVEVDCSGLSGEKQLSDGLGEARDGTGSVEPNLRQVAVACPQLLHLGEDDLVVQFLGDVCLSRNERRVEHNTVCRIEVEVLVQAVVDAGRDPVLGTRGYEVLHDVVVPSAEARERGAVRVVESRRDVDVRGPHAEPAAVLRSQDGVLGSHRHCRPDPLVHVQLDRIEGVRRREPGRVSADSDAEVLGVADVREHGDHVEGEEGADLSLGPRQDVGSRFGGRCEVATDMTAARNH